MIQSQRESCFEAYNNKRKSHKVRDRELLRLSYTSMSNREKVVLMPINVRDRQSYRETSRFIHKQQKRHRHCLFSVFVRGLNKEELELYTEMKVCNYLLKGTI